MALDNSNTLGIVSNTPRVRAARSLQEWIMDGRLVAGQQLPPEVQLAAKLKVSRTTMRLALEDIEKEGLICSDKRRRIVRSHVKPQRKFLSDTIALIMDSPVQFNRRQMRGSWHSNFIYTGAVDAIRTAGYDALTIHPSHLVGDLIQRLIAERPKGVILMRNVLYDESGMHLIKALREGNIPFVIYGDIGGLSRSAVSFVSEIDSVISDHEAGSHAVTEWLIGRGCKRILRFWQLTTELREAGPEWLTRRDHGYEKAIKEAGLESIPAVNFYFEGDILSKEQFDTNTRLVAGYLVEYLKGTKPIDAIVAISDALIPYICAALRIHGKEPNRDILIAGYDNMWDDLPESKLEPIGPACTIDKKNLEIGSELMALLQDRIDGKLIDKGQHRVIIPELVVREDVPKRSSAS